MKSIIILICIIHLIRLSSQSGKWIEDLAEWRGTEPPPKPEDKKTPEEKMREIRPNFQAFIIEKLKQIETEAHKEKMDAVAYRKALNNVSKIESEMKSEAAAKGYSVDDLNQYFSTVKAYLTQEQNEYEVSKKSRGKGKSKAKKSREIKLTPADFTYLPEQLLQKLNIKISPKSGETSSGSKD